MAVLIDNPGLNLADIDSRITGNVSNDDSLKDVTPFHWSDDVLSGKAEIKIGKNGITEISHV